METLEELPDHQVMEKSFHKNVSKVDILMKEYGKTLVYICFVLKFPIHVQLMN